MRRLPATLALLALVLGAPAGAATVFTTDFESGIPPEFSAPGASTQAVQGWDGLGVPGNQFGGSFLRYDSTEVLDTQLTLSGLPPHDTLTLGFLLAVIDSWDGVELLEVLVDGVTLFSNSFQLATGDESSYVAPPGGLLSSGTDLGFSAGGYYDHDRAYDMSVEPAFIGIPHTADSVTIVWRLVATPGGGAAFWQGDGDESWAIDNVTVAVVAGPATTTTSSTTVTTSSTTVATSSTSTTLPAQLLSGKKLLLKWRPDETKKRLLNILSKDKAFTLGDGPESADDPMLHGGSLRVYATGGDEFDDTYDFQPEEWRYIRKKGKASGAVLGYKLHTSTFGSILVKPGKILKVVAKGTMLGHTLASDPRPVLVELRLGAERYCMGFGGDVRYVTGKKYLAKNASADDAACPP